MVDIPEDNSQRSISGPVEPVQTAETPGQHALAFAPDGSSSQVIEPPDRPRFKRRDADRFDVRRTGDYIARRGRTPAEQLHNIARLSLPQVIQYLRKHVKGVSDEWCVNFWFRCQQELAPLVHFKLGAVDPAELGGPVQGDMRMSHYLAASAMGARLAEQAAAARGVGAPGGGGWSPECIPVDQPHSVAQSDGYVTAPPATPPLLPLILPPKGSD